MMTHLLWVERRTNPDDLEWKRDPMSVPLIDQPDIVASTTEANKRLGWNRYRIHVENK